MAKQFKKFKISNQVTFIEAIDANHLDQSDAIGKLSLTHSACTYSHLKALDRFVKSDKNYCVILEDDSNIEHSALFNKNIIDLISQKYSRYGIFQLQPIVRIEDTINVGVRNRSFWNFGTGAYLISMEHAKEILNLFSTKEKIEKNFISKVLIDPRSNQEFFTPPTAEEIVYFNYEKSCSIPIFTTIIGSSDLLHPNKEEALLQEIHSNSIIDSNIFSIVKLLETTS